MMGGFQTRNKSVFETVNRVKEEWAKISKQGITEKELDEAKKTLAKFEKKIGMDNLKICHFVTFEESLKLNMSMDKLFFIMKQLNYIRSL